MELQIYSPGEDGFIKEINWNHEEIKKEVSERISFYENLIYTEDQIKTAKEDRAKLRKFVDVLETKRKDIKKQCLAPYEAFEKQMKEIIGIVNKPILMIDGQVKNYEENQKAEKKEAITAYWQSLLEENKIPSGITLNQFFDEKWLNLSVNLKKVFEEINARVEQIGNDLATLENLPEFAFEAIETYKCTLNLNEAIREGKRLAEMQQRKAEAERLKAEQEAAIKAEATATVPQPEPVKANINDPEDIENVASKRWVSFTALLSTEDAYALKDFFNSRNIEFKAVRG